MLYLDTARLGRMSHGAQVAHEHFASFAGEEAGSLYLDHFLRSGIDAWPDALRRRYAGLSAWRGICSFKQSLKCLAGVFMELPLLIAGRSAQLMKFAARMLFQPCHNPLVADTGWPTYHALLERERFEAGRSITQVFVRDAILQERASEDEIVARISSAYVKETVWWRTAIWMTPF